VNGEPGEISDDGSEPPYPREPAPRRRSLGSLVPLVCMVASAFLLARSKDDLAYLFRSADPIDLGQPGAYHLENARSGSYVKLRGEVHSEGARFQRLFGSGKVWPVAGAPVLIERRDFTDLRGKVQAEGLLRVDDDLPSQYHPVIAMFMNLHQLAPPGPDGHVWVIDQGRVPRGFDLANGWLAVLAALFVANAWWFLRPMFRR
jgi:hypothetical protein